jgi:hypothetical protein
MLSSFHGGHDLQGTGHEIMARGRTARRRTDQPSATIGHFTAIVGARVDEKRCLPFYVLLKHKP